MDDRIAPIHYKLAKVGLRVGGPYGFALAGGHAVAAHGILQRPSEDVDMFVDWHLRADFTAAVSAVVREYQSEGYVVRVDHQTETFARLYVIDTAVPAERHRVELVANWRMQPPVQMDVGPVLHIDDVMAGKVDALYNRAAARDFLDIDAAITTGRYNMDQLCGLAETIDAGFDRAIFAEMLGHIDRFDDEEFTQYGISASDLPALRARVAQWRAELTSSPPHS